MREQAQSEAAARAKQVLAEAASGSLSQAELLEATVTVAAALLDTAARVTTRQEHARARLLARLMDDPDGQIFSTTLTDRVYRSRDPGRVVDASRYLLRRLGVPRYLPPLARLQLHALLRAGPFVPELAAKGILGELRAQTRSVVLSAEPSELARHLAARCAQRVRVNLNYLGEAVLGEREAEQRITDYCELLARPEVEAISVKLSSIASRIDLVGYEETLFDLQPRLRRIFRAALTHQYERPDGTRAPKLVSLDMEAYRELQLTFDLFTSLLDEAELLPLGACMVLQAYLPDAFALQRKLTAFAQRRMERGGAPLRLRLVKGANLAAERVESSLRGWPVPTYDTKLEVDANYKRMIEYGSQPEHARAVHLGIASHNVFELAFGLVQRALHRVEPYVGFELLEGMADPLRRALQALCDDVLLYCPIVSEDSMQTAIAYLMRRLDENTASENFLRKSFGMRAGDESFASERARFEQSLLRRHEQSARPRRAREHPASGAPPSTGAFENEPDTDFALEENRARLSAALAAYATRERFDLPMQLGGQDSYGTVLAEGFDPSRPGLVPYRFGLASEADIERCLAHAARAAKKHESSRSEERDGWLAAAAAELRSTRAELVAAMVLDAGKRVEQGDAEVSEAIDFAEYYRRNFREHEALPALRLRPRGVVLVTPPWNFPLAIPAGGVLAALMAGNAVILKPALETVLVARLFAESCWRAGVPRELLQLMICEDELGSRLIRDARVNAVVLTGATATARLFQSLRPELALFAETGGKNAVILSALADRDLAVAEVAGSAFEHAGQKCSAASLLVCEDEVYDDPDFRRVLEDTVQSLPVGSAWRHGSVVTPLIREPSSVLLRALTTLEPGESWLVPPRPDPENPRLWAPGVKWDVSAGSFTHTTELFGPVLGVMRARDLDHALELANATPYGLTAGLFSLDEREQLRFSTRMKAGNLYINRGITGAIVQRQPFGGEKGSSFGPGSKAGGPNYVLQLCQLRDGEEASTLDPPAPAAAAFLARVRRQVTPPDQERLARAACLYAHSKRTYFALEHDPSRRLGERNLLRYRPCAPLLVRVSSDAVVGDALLACAAALTADLKPMLSVHPEIASSVPWLDRLPLISYAEESAEAVAQRVPGLGRIRAVGSVEPELRSAALAAGVHIAAEPVLLAGRYELLHYYREQAVSNTYARYGSLHTQRLLVV